MPDTATTWDDRGVAGRLAGTRFRAVRWFRRIDSTNRYLVDEAAAGAPEGLVAVADEQTAGRGRLGRTWVAPPGSSLLASALVRPRVATDRLHLVTVAAAVAAAEALEALAGVTARTKWPNDLLVDDRKIAGILAEAVPAPDGTAVVVGCGINVAWGELPAELADRATSLDLVCDVAVDRADLLVAWLAAFDRGLGALDASDLEELRAAAVRRSATLGRRVRVELPEGDLVGRADRFSELGHLVVVDDAGRETEVRAGDVVHLRAAGDVDDPAPGNG